MKYFKISDFDSPDITGSGNNMDKGFLGMLECARDMAGVPFIINSGYRTVAYNRDIGGVENSSHTKGVAADIKTATSAQRYVMITALLKAGFNRIGIANTFIHVDSDKQKPPNVMWKY